VFCKENGIVKQTITTYFWKFMFWNN
jgi:hypothetical protein